MPEISSLPMVIPSRGIHFFVSQEFRFPESKLKVAPSRSQTPPRHILVSPTISPGRHAQNEIGFAGGFVHWAHWSVPRT